MYQILKRLTREQAPCACLCYRIADCGVAYAPPFPLHLRRRQSLRVLHRPLSNRFDYSSFQNRHFALLYVVAIVVDWKLYVRKGLKCCEMLGEGAGSKEILHRSINAATAMLAFSFRANKGCGFAGTDVNGHDEDCFLR